jgi:subtilase family serine protease
MPRLNVECLEDRLTPSRPGGGISPPPPPPVITNPTPVGLTPAEVRHAYGFDAIPALAGDYNSAGAGQAIAIVMAGHDPNIASDLGVFSQQFGLPAVVTSGPDANFVQLNEKGSASGPWAGVNASWAGEISLDVEWAHAIAPGAKIVLVEANSASVSDLLAAIDTAAKQPGVSAVSMSWGLLQGRGMGNYEQHFTAPSGHTPITFVAATLDNGLSFPNGLYWPSVSPSVLAVGGTSLTLADTDGDGIPDYAGETGWGPSTGGVSTWFAQPAYQKGVVTQTTQYRAVPDVSYHADNTVAGFAVYDTVALNGQAGWFNAYGDSAGAPQWAALVAIANQQRAETGLLPLDGATQVLPGLYALAAQDYASDTSTYFHDVVSDGASTGKYSAGSRYDLVTGLGTPKADALVAALALLSNYGTAVSFAPPSDTSATLGGTATAAGGFGDSLPAPFPAQAPSHLSAAAAEHLPPSVAELFFLAPSETKRNPDAWWNPGE